MSVIKDGVVFCEPDCWLSCSWVFKGMCHLHIHAFHVLGKLRMHLSNLQDVESLSWIFCLKESSLIILCRSVQYSTLLTAGMVLLCMDKCGPHIFLFLHRETYNLL